MTVSGNNVYIVWQDYNTTSGMEHVMLSVSNDGGMTFSDPYVLGNGFLLSMSGGYSGPVVSRTGRHIAADGDNLYAIWLDTDSDSRLYHLVFRASDDGAESFGDPIVLARAGYDEIHSAALSATGSNVHVSWVNGTRRGADSPVPLEHSLIARSSHDAGESFENEQIVHTAHQELTIIPDMAATEDSLYLVWTQDNDLMFSKSEDAGTTFSTPLTISTNRKLAEGTPERYIFQFYPFITTFESGVGANDHGTMIAWLDKEAGNDKQYLSSVMSLDSGDTFRPIERFGFYGPLPPIHDTIAVGNDGTIHYAYRASEQDVLNMGIITFSPGQIYGALLNNDTAGWPLTPSPTTNGNSVYAVWLNGTDFSMPEIQELIQQMYIVTSTDSGRTYSKPALVQEIVTVPEFGAFSTVLLVISSVSLVIVGMRYYKRWIGASRPTNG
jgi:hypothetical protein